MPPCVPKAVLTDEENFAAVRIYEAAMRLADEAKRGAGKRSLIAYSQRQDFRTRDDDRAALAALDAAGRAANADHYAAAIEALTVYINTKGAPR